MQRFPVSAPLAIGSAASVYIDDRANLAAPVNIKRRIVIRKDTKNAGKSMFKRLAGGRFKGDVAHGAGFLNFNVIRSLSPIES